MAIDKEMQRALEADGEKLRQLTGKDHGPYFAETNHEKEVMTMPERECPKCGAPMDHIADEPDVNILGGWACTNEACRYFIHDSEFDQGDD